MRFQYLRIDITSLDNIKWRSKSASGQSKWSSGMSQRCNQAKQTSTTKNEGTDLEDIN